MTDLSPRLRRIVDALPLTPGLRCWRSAADPAPRPGLSPNG